MKTIMQGDITRCWKCGKPSTEAHHIIHGTRKNKEFSEKNGLIAYLCRECHEKCHHTSAELDFELKRAAQERYVEIYDPISWMKFVGRNYV